MKIRQLRCFLVLAEELNFTRAAELCNLGQPGLSKLVAALENDLGVALLERDTKRVHLTPAGEAFLVTARATLGQLDRGMKQLRQHAMQAELRVAFDASMYGTSFQAALREFRRIRPETALVRQEMTATVVLHALQTGAADLGLLIGPAEPTGVEFEKLPDEELSVALPEHHPLAARQEVRLADLRDEPVLTYDRALKPVSLDLHALRSDTVDERLVPQVNKGSPSPSLCSVRGAWELVAAGECVHVALTAYQQVLVLPPGVTVRPLLDWTLPLFVGWRKATADIQAILRVLRDQSCSRGVSDTQNLTVEADTPVRADHHVPPPVPVFSSSAV